MAEYAEAVEGSLLVEEEAIEQAEILDGDPADRGARAHFHAYLSFYISAISLIVAVAALLTALAADQSMEETLDGLADMVQGNNLRVELRCHEIQRDLVAMRTGQSNDAVADLASLSKQLDRVQLESQTLRSEALHTDKAHYVLAVGITFLQVATALAATVGITKKHTLLIPSSLFAVCGVGMTVAGALEYLA
jgi:hypothetical protein